MRNTSRITITLSAIIACVISGAGCFHKQTTFVPSTPTPAVIDVPASTEGAKASTGGIQATITPVLDTGALANVLPDDSTQKDFKASVADEQKNPVPMQDGTRTEFTTVSKTFTKTDGDQTITIQTAITDTRSIPVLTAFIDAYKEFTTDQTSRKKVPIQNNTAWLTYSKDSATATNGFGSITMLYRNRFLIQIDGNLGVTQDELLAFLNAYHFDQLK